MGPQAHAPSQKAAARLPFSFNMGPSRPIRAPFPFSAGPLPVPPEDLRSTPARLTATAAAKLPRLFLLCVGLVYILAGLFYRDPWKTDDVTGLATMFTALSGQDHAWLLPQVGHLAQAQNGPLITWVGAFFIWAASPVFEWFFSPLDAAIIASRLPNLLWFGLLTASIW